MYVHCTRFNVELRPPETTLLSLNRLLPTPPGRRDGDRHLTLLRVVAVTVDGHRHLCLIRNASCGGMMMRTYTDLKPGARLSIEFGHGESVVATVRWKKDDNVGLMFDHAIDVLQLLESAMTGPRPRMPRVETGGIVWVGEDAVTHRCMALDISQGGLKFRSLKSLRPRRQVVVTLAGMPPIAGVICWSDGDCYGVSFNDVLSLQMLVRWLKAQQMPRMRAAG